MKPLYKQFTSPEQFRSVDVRRVSYAAVMVLSFVITEIGRRVYRPFIYGNGIDDFGLADSIGNLGGIIVQIFLGLALMNSNLKQGGKLIGFFMIGYIVYEILQPVLPKGTFDWKDIYGTIIGSILAAVVFFLIRKNLKNNRLLFKL
jgi:hypothetical protein